jgi:hypothetical protein
LKYFEDSYIVYATTILRFLYSRRIKQLGYGIYKLCALCAFQKLFRAITVTKDGMVDVLASLYLLYKAHAEELKKGGYSQEEAFWLNFACLPFLPWDGESKDEIRLSQVVRLYLGIYQFNTDSAIKAEGVPAFVELLIDRYRMAKDIVSIEDEEQLRMELGRFALPHQGDTAKLSEAGSIVLLTIAEWRSQTGQERLPCRLVEDVGD